MFTAFTCHGGQLSRIDLLAEEAKIAAAAPTGTEDAILWADILRPDAAEMELAEAMLGMSLPTLQEMEEIEPSSRLYEEDGAQVMTVPIVVGLDTDAPQLAPVTFIVSPKRLVTLRHARSMSFEQVVTRRTRSKGKNSAESLFFDLLEAIVDRGADVLERSAAHCDAVSRKVFARKNLEHGDEPVAERNLEALLAQIGREGDLLIRLRESLVALGRMLSYYSARHPAAGRDARAQLKTIQRDVGALTDQAGFLSGNINFLLDATLGFINLEQNQIIKLFTVAAVAFLPPTLIASIYGMNFHIMPELDWRFGYPLALVMMVISAALPLAYFRRRGWL